VGKLAKPMRGRYGDGSVFRSPNIRCDLEAHSACDRVLATRSHQTVRKKLAFPCSHPPEEQLQAISAPQCDAIAYRLQGNFVHFDGVLLMHA